MYNLAIIGRFFSPRLLGTAHDAFYSRHHDLIIIWPYSYGDFGMRHILRLFDINNDRDNYGLYP